MDLAVITSEFAPKKRRGTFLAILDSLSAWAVLFQALITLIALVSFKSAIQADQSHLDYVWRITLGFAAIPPLIGLYLRRNMCESPRYTIDIDFDHDRAECDVECFMNPHLTKTALLIKMGENKPTAKEFLSFLAHKEQIKLLLGICVPRFAINVAFYGVNLNSKIFLQVLGFGDSQDAYTNVFNGTVGQIFVVLLGLFPGYLYTIF